MSQKFIFNPPIQLKISRFKFLPVIRVSDTFFYEKCRTPKTKLRPHDIANLGGKREIWSGWPALALVREAQSLPFHLPTVQKGKLVAVGNLGPTGHIYYKKNFLHHICSPCALIISGFPGQNIFV